MRRFRDIIEDIKAPDINNLWLDNGELKYWSANGWTTIGGISSSINWNDINGKPEFAKVATSGSYNDLSNKPTIPPAYTLPNASTSVRGGVLMAASITDLAGTEDTTAICTKVNALLAALRTAGMLNQ